jgi:predicted Zn finger-like uncharacterized protein
MKITCQSCQSKYTVSDEKVQGKTVKIKCRKCGATILVNSGGVTTSAPADPVSLSSGGGDAGGSSFLVNVAEGDQRSMTMPEIIVAYQSSVVNAETYVWADGMNDWQPLGQVDAIVAALNAPPASAVPVSAAPEPEPRAAARRDPGPRGPDLFGSRPATDDLAVASPFNGSSAAARASAASSMASAPAARAGEENSMLFSLSALTAKAGTSSSSSSRALPAHDREDSGIIDLKALAASASQAQAQGPSVASALPDGGLFQLAAPSSVMGAAPPVVSPSVPPPKSKAPIFIGLGAVVAVGAIVGVFLITKGGPPAPALTPTTTDSATASAAPTATDTATAAPTTTAVASAATSAEPAASAKAGKGGRGGAVARGGGGGLPPKGGGASSPSPAPAPAPAGPPKKSGGCGCAAGDLMCAMKCSAK